MAGKPGRPGAAKNKKGGRVGTGGNGKQALEGRGPTPKAEDRKNHKAFKMKQAAERKAKAHAQELQAQVRQIIEAHKVKREGESEYRFNDGTVIRTLLVNNVLRRQLASGSLVIARHGEGFELLPRAAAEKVRERDASVIVLDNSQPGSEPSTGNAEDDAYYAQFQVPDDLVW